MDLTHLNTLKDKLVHANEFIDVMNYFLDEFGENSAFLGLGQKVQAPELEAMIEAAGSAVFGREAKLRSFLPVRIDEYQFIHAGGMLNGRLLMLIFFEDINKGLLALSAPGDKTHFLRFSAETLPPRVHERN